MALVSALVAIAEITLTSALGPVGEDDGDGLSKLFTRLFIEGTILVITSGGGIHVVEVADKVMYNSTW